MNIGERVRYYRELQNLTISEVSAIAKISPDRLRDIENSKVEMSAMELNNFLVGLNIRPDKFMQYSGDDNKEIIDEDTKLKLARELKQLELQGLDLKQLEDQETMNKVLYLYKFMHTLQEIDEELCNEFKSMYNVINDIDAYRESLKRYDVNLLYTFNDIVCAISSYNSFDIKLENVSKKLADDFRRLKLNI